MGMENLVVASLNNKWTGWVVLMMMVITIGLFAKSSYDDRNQSDANTKLVEQMADVVNCLNGYIVENSRVSKARSAASMKRENAVDQVITGAGQLSAQQAKTPEQRVRQQLAYNNLFAEYNEVLLEVAAERIKNPLPVLPESCNDVQPITKETE